MFGRKKTVSVLGVAQVDAETVVASYAATNQKLYEQNESLKLRVQVLEEGIAGLRTEREAVLAALGVDEQIAELKARLALAQSSWSDDFEDADDFEDGDDE